MSLLKTSVDIKHVFNFNNLPTSTRPSVDLLFSLHHASSESYKEVSKQTDSHVIGGAMLQVLKEMAPSLFHEIYADLLDIEITEDTVHNKKIIMEQVNKLDAPHCELVR